MNLCVSFTPLVLRAVHELFKLLHESSNLLLFLRRLSSFCLRLGDSSELLERFRTRLRLPAEAATAGSLGLRLAILISRSILGPCLAMDELSDLALRKDLGGTAAGNVGVFLDLDKRIVPKLLARVGLRLLLRR